MRPLLSCVLLCAAATALEAQVQVEFDTPSQSWHLSNGIIEARMELRPNGQFRVAAIGPPGASWSAPSDQPSFPVRAVLGDTVFSGETAYRLVEQRSESAARNGKRLVIVLQDLAARGQLQLEFELYPGLAVLRQKAFLKNLSAGAEYVTSADLLSYRFATESGPLDVFHIDQWDPTTTTSFQLHKEQLGPEGAVVAIRTGADARDIAWFAFRDGMESGLFAGLEFDGRAQLSLDRSASDGSLRLSANVPGLYRLLAPGQTFAIPAAFVGTFRGDWDRAGEATRRFMEAILAQPAPAAFPWVSWDSWGYGLDLTEQVLLDNANAAARLGMELFVVDLGWARKIGDWREDPLKFPRGLRAISDHVHRLGMKFGLHFALAEAAPDSPVLQQHANWISSESDDYFGAVSLCLANRETRDWVVAEAVRIIDDYGVDYIVQDGENMVKRCRRTDHSHHSADSNYSNSVDGLNWVVSEIQRLRPNVVWENCEDGGHMLTFQMVQHYVTSITNDASGALDARKGTWGALYPLSPRYAARYMPENPWSTYVTRSYLFGGPWHFMNRLAEMNSGDVALAEREIALYKSLRGVFADAQVFHLLGPPAAGSIDAIEGYSPAGDKAVIVVVRDGAPENSVLLRPKGLVADGTYTVRAQEDPSSTQRTGRSLMEDGIRVSLPFPQMGEVVVLDRVR